MPILLNGEPRPHASSLTILGLITKFAPTTLDGLAVCLNGQVIPRHQWAAQSVKQGDKVEVVTAVRGG